MRTETRENNPKRRKDESHPEANQLGSTRSAVAAVAQLRFRLTEIDIWSGSHLKHALCVFVRFKRSRAAIILLACAAVVGSSQALAQISNAFSPTGNLNTGRNGHRAITLNDGRVLITGGYDGNENALSSSEIYDPATGTFTPTGSLTTERRNCGITLLDNGTVLVTGGYDAGFRTLASAEIYDPGTGVFTPTQAMSTARADHIAARLNDGTVLIAGGFDASGNSLSSAELYVPSTRTFAPTASLNIARGFSTATALLDGTVLIEGGWSLSGALSSAETYDPVLKTFNMTGSLIAARVRNTATLLNGGKVLIVGGEDSANNILSSAEIYNPTTHAFTLTGNLNTARGDHAATLLTNGSVLVEGGFACNPSNCLATTMDMSASAEIYDPVVETFSPTGSLGTARQVHTATLLTNGMVLIAGGWSSSNSGLPSAELYQPGSVTPPGLETIAITPTAPSLLTGTSQSLAAIGTFRDNSTQALASVVWSSSDPTVATVSNDSGSNSGALNDSTSSGVLWGAAAGSATESACAGTVCGSTAVTVLSPSTVHGFVLLGSPLSQLVPAGEAATYSIRLLPVSGFRGQIAFSCTAVPVASTCRISPPVVNLDEKAATTVTVQTTAFDIRSSLGAGDTSHNPGQAGGVKSLELLGLAALFTVSLGCSVIAPRRRWLTRNMVLGILLAQLVGCGGSGSEWANGTPPGTYVIGVVGTSGGISNVAKFHLVVQ